MAKSKVQYAVERFGKANLGLEKIEARVAREFSTIIFRLEERIKARILLEVLKLRGSNLSEVNLQLSLLQNDIKAVISNSLRRPLGDSQNEIFIDTDESAIRKAIAMSVIAGSEQAHKLSSFFISKEDAKIPLREIRAANQEALSRRVRAMADAFNANIEDWIYTHVSSKLASGATIDTVQPEVEDNFSDKLSPFLVGGVTPVSRAKMIGRGETRLGFMAGIAAFALLKSKKDKAADQQLYAKSMAIHDGLAWPDSIEAEWLSSGWIKYPEPYFIRTDFRRRPNDRCYDVILPLSMLQAEGITPESDEGVIAKAEILRQAKRQKRQEAQANKLDAQAAAAAKKLQTTRNQVVKKRRQP